jgi:hypothetical protein
LIESPTEEEEEEDEREYDKKEMTLFIKRFNKYITKRISYKGDRKEKPRSKKVCYNCGKNGHFIAHMRGRKKKMTRKRSMIKATRKKRNFQRRSLMVKLM